MVSQVPMAPQVSVQHPLHSQHLYKGLESQGPTQLTHTINTNTGVCTTSEVVSVSFFTEFQGET